MRVLITILLVLLWLALLSVVPATLFWRDSGEFILSAFLLDVAHPAGFPLYAQLSNLFALIPAGTIAWRVNAFSCFLVVLHLFLTGLLAWSLLRTIFRLENKSAALLALIPPLLLLTAPVYVKQAFVAEVYVLNAIFVELLLLCYLEYRHRKDLRFLILAALLAGLGLGNHASLGVILAGFLAVLAFELKTLRRAILPAFCAGLLGLAVYAYIPARALTHPPLNTGCAVTPLRFYNQITDARDRVIRGPVQAERVLEVKNGRAPWLSKLKADCTKLQDEFPLLLLAPLGVIALWTGAPRILAVLLIAGAGNYLFFRGWSPDPWIPLFSILALLIATLFGYGLRNANPVQRSNFSVFALLPFILLTLAGLPDFKDLDSIRTFSLPQTAARSLLAPLPKGGVLLTENSWFQLLYLQRIEGYREDVVLVYPGDIFHPELFRELTWKNARGVSFTAAEINSAAADAAPLGIKRLGAFTDFVTQTTALSFEPSQGINGFFKQVARLDDSGRSYLEHGVPGRLAPGFSEQKGQTLRMVRDAVRSTWLGFNFETQRYFEEQLVAVADLLDAAGHPAEALSLVSKLCLPLEEQYCSLVPLNNLATYLIHYGRYFEAAQLLLVVVSDERWRKAEVFENLVIALSHLSEAERRVFESVPLAAQLLNSMKQ